MCLLCGAKKILFHITKKYLHIPMGNSVAKEEFDQFAQEIRQQHQTHADTLSSHAQGMEDLENFNKGFKMSLRNHTTGLAELEEHVKGRLQSLHQLIEEEQCDLGLFDAKTCDLRVCYDICEGHKCPAEKLGEHLVCHFDKMTECKGKSVLENASRCLRKKMRDEGMMCNDSGMIVENGTTPCYDLWNPQRIKDGLTFSGENKICMAKKLGQNGFCDSERFTYKMEKATTEAECNTAKGTWTSCDVSNEQCPIGCMIATPDSRTVINMFSEFPERAEQEAERQEQLIRQVIIKHEKDLRIRPIEPRDPYLQGAVIRQDGPRDLRAVIRQDKEELLRLLHEPQTETERALRDEKASLRDVQKRQEKLIEEEQCDLGLFNTQTCDLKDCESICEGRNCQAERWATM